MKKVQPGVSSKAAFTRTDLVFASATIGMLFLLAASATATTSTQSQSTGCVSNNRKLIDAWSHYAADNNGAMTGPVHGGLAQQALPFEGPGSSATSARPWCVGWLDWTATPANTNHNHMTHPSYGSLALYLNRDKEVFKCPSDRYVSPAQASRGWTSRARSYCANIGLGDGNGGPGDGPWDPAYVKARRLSQLVNPDPSLVYVFIEEHPDSMNDGAVFSPRFTGTRSWIDFPGNFHNGAATLAFADGHVEQKLWASNVRTLPVRYTFTSPAPSAGDQADILYLAARTPKNP
jgi:prepilin-type processing-associated H-X9-DG protein